MTKIKYQFDLADLTTGVSLVAIGLTLAGFWWSTIIFIINCLVNLVYTIIKVKRINLLILNLGLLVLNFYFLLG